MPLYSLLTELDRKVILFSYEKQSKNKTLLPLEVFNDEYRSYILTEGDYILWELGKRKLTKAEIISHSWLATSKKNISLLLSCNYDGQVKVNDMFSDGVCGGQWVLENGILKIHFNYQDQDYDISVIANNNRLVHSALQIIDSLSVDILKVLSVSQARHGKALTDN